jgi:hypothetical protein
VRNTDSSRHTDAQQIAFGPGGLIRDVPENRKLLEEIREAPLLSSTDLLKLAGFYRGYSTNQELANHLALIGLAKLVSDPEIREALTKTSALPASLWDVAEDSFDGVPEGRESSDDSFLLLPDVQWVSVSGIGLLIETPRRRRHHEKRHYVIGVSPDPASLEA